MNRDLRTTNLKTVLVVDGGGRGAALVDRYAQSHNVSRILAIPGNELIPMLVKKPVKIFPKVKTTDIKKIIKICTEKQVDLVDIAHDDAVAVGLTDALQKKGFRVFGSTKAAGQIEWDKAWARKFMNKFKIPHPVFKIYRSQKKGIDFIKKQKDSSWWVKASGLAAGKGALFAQNQKDAISAIKSMENFGNAGKTYLIEKCLTGEEFSAFAVVSGRNFEIIGYAQDHKRAFDGDLGPNTGGMGCSSPPMAVTKQIESQVKLIFKKTVDGLYKLKRPYSGVLYLGGIIDKDNKVWVIEFNARWGDPEAQVILPSIKNDYLQLVEQSLNGKIPKIEKDNKYRVVVTAASKGYPSDYSKVVGKKIIGLDKILKSGVKIFGAAVKKQDKKYLAAGGRLFYVLGEGNTVAIARKKAYNAFSKVRIGRGLIHYRKDIGYRDLNRLSA